MLFRGRQAVTRKLHLLMITRKLHLLMITIKLHLLMITIMKKAKIKKVYQTYSIPLSHIIQ